ncbi:hypothetical protein ABEB36_009719 [Hypothenemus hampei]|uniref:STING ligand-binding domain-containing protein n=1 Tax=Hypothenemus hampei TaxID=57062 RepID=A0ABD1EH88_HYPHA
MNVNTKMPYNNHISEVKNVKTVFVSQKGDKQYFPKTIPKERDTFFIKCVYTFVLLASICVHMGVSQDYTSLPGFYSTAIILSFSMCLIERIILFQQEIEHTASRYGNDKIRVFKAAFYFNHQACIAFAINTVYMAYYVTKYGTLSVNVELNYFSMLFIYFFPRILDLEECPLSESLNITKNNGLDYGSGMAYSFFYGYIHYMMQKIGEPNKDLKEMLRDYESKNNIEFAVHKIFILIPKSFKCFESIQEASNIIEMRSTLLEKKITVAGVRDRIYKHSVYSIKQGNEKIFVCCEYATPLKTFREVFDHTTPHGEFYNRFKNDILLQFYLTLKQILKTTKCDSMCELIYYEDMDEKGMFYDVGRILLAKIKRTEIKIKKSV